MRTEKTTFLLGKKNLAVMAIGFFILVLGFLLMSGGKSPSPDEFVEAEIFSPRRITLGPITVLTGFLIVGIGIMVKPKKTLIEQTHKDA